jgi:hypothetical protein
LALLVPVLGYQKQSISVAIYSGKLCCNKKQTVRFVLLHRRRERERERERKRERRRERDRERTRERKGA